MKEHRIVFDADECYTIKGRGFVFCGILGPGYAFPDRDAMTKHFVGKDIEIRHQGSRFVIRCNGVESFARGGPMGSGTPIGLLVGVSTP